MDVLNEVRHFVVRQVELVEVGLVPLDFAELGLVRHVHAPAQRQAVLHLL